MRRHGFRWGGSLAPALHRLLRWLSFAGCLSAAVLAFPDPAKGAKADLDTYFSAHGAERLSISLDRIGIVVREGIPAESLTAYVNGVGLGAADTLDLAIYTFALPRAMSRDSLAAFVRNVRASGSRFIVEAGIVATIGGGKTPLLVTDKFVAQFRPEVTQAQINALNASHAVDVIEANVLKPNLYLLKVTARSGADAATMANRYHRSRFVRYAHPNFVQIIRYRQYQPYLPNDRLFHEQWHLDNGGQDGGTEDADIDWALAEGIVQQAGTRNVTIAVIDGAFDLNHPDLEPNLWVNDPEAQSTSIAGQDDSPQNGFIDDIHGYDFFPCEDANASWPCGDGDPSVGPPNAGDDIRNKHGTPVAGLVGAVMNNDKGVVGTCPNAKLMLIQMGFTPYYLARAFDYASRNHADIVSCSWGQGGQGADTQVLNEAIDEAVSKGTVVLFAMDYAKTWGDCTRDGSWDLAERPNVIAVSGSTNWDRKLPNAACGDYVDVLGPTGRGSGVKGSGFKGTRNIATTDVQSTRGYNSDYAISSCPEGTEFAGFPDATNYTRCFTGTSAATPIVAGVAGMILTVNTDLTPTMVQRLLQDTADKIEPSEAAYGDQTGFSRPTSQSASTHGYGRVNAFEAVRLAAPADAGGKGGVDIFLRDNRLDWGNTEQPSNVTFEQTRGYEPHWHTMDIKIDAGPSYQANPSASPTPSKAFDALIDEEPVAGATNRIYIRVRNRGPVAADQVKVRIYRAYAGAAAPVLPKDFWSKFETNTFTPSSTETGWAFIGEKSLAGSLPYSGCTAAKEARATVSSPPSDNAGIFDFIDWVGPPASGADYNLSVERFCLLAIVDSPDDHVSPYRKLLAQPPDPLVRDDFLVDVLTASDNNVTLRNFHNVRTSTPGRFKWAFYLRNTTPQEIHPYYRVVAPIGWVSSNGEVNWPAELAQGWEVPASLVIGAPPGATGEIKVFQFSTPSPVAGEAPTGGMTIRLTSAGPAAGWPPWWWFWVILFLLLLVIVLVVAVVWLAP